MNTNTFRMRGLAGSLLVTLSLVAFSTLAADTDSKGQLDSSDFKFASAAAKGGAMEVSLGKLAQDKASSDAVKQFGQKMVQDHGMAGDKLMKIASQKNATLSTDPTAAQQRAMDKLMKLSGPDFDKAYVAAMVRDHKADLKEFQKASRDVKDPDLKEFAATTAPVVEGHLKMIEDLQASMTGKTVSENK